AWTSWQNNTPYFAYLAPWGVPSGLSYSDSIVVNPSTFPNGTVINWSYPANSQTTIHDVYSYNRVQWGSYYAGDLPPNGITPTPKQVNALTTFMGAFNISLSGLVGRDDVLWEEYLTSGPNSGSNLFEVGIFLQDTNPEMSFQSSLPRYD